MAKASRNQATNKIAGLSTELARSAAQARTGPAMPYVLVAIVKKRIQLSASLYEILQILSLTMFERMPIDQLLSLQPIVVTEAVSPNQLTLFD